MADEVDTYSEKYRSECEARHWLAHTGGDRAAVDELIDMIGAKRGKLAAERLRQEMRRQYQLQGSKTT